MHPSEYLSHVIFDLQSSKLSLHLPQFPQKDMQVHIACLLNKEDMLIFHHKVVESDYIFMLDVPQDSYLPNSGRWNAIITVFNACLFDRNLLSSLPVHAQIYCSICTLTQCLL